MKFFYKYFLGYFIISLLFFNAQVMAQDKMSGKSPIPTNRFRSEDEKKYHDVVTRALKEYVAKQKETSETDTKQKEDKIEIIYPPPKAEKQKEKNQIEVSSDQDRPAEQVSSPKPSKVKNAEENLPFQKDSPFELVVDGKRYRTLKEYKLDRIKDILEESFFQANINVDSFTDEEMIEIISSIRKRQGTESRDSLAEMKKMMDIYNQKNKEDGSLTVDLNKIKTIIIPAK